MANFSSPDYRAGWSDRGKKESELHYFMKQSLWNLYYDIKEGRDSKKILKDLEELAARISHKNS